MSDGSVLVTGGCGFVGQALCKLLQRKGHRTLVLDQPPDPDTAEQSRRLEPEVPCDIRRATHLWTVFQAERIESIVHLAAVLPTAAQREPLRTTQVNITGSLNLLEMARQFDVRRVVFASSLSVYGTCPPGEAVAETHPAAPEDLYGASKLYVEQLGASYRVRFGVSFVSLRMGRVIGPGAQSSSSAWRSRIFEDLRSTTATEISLPYAGQERLLLVCVDDIAKMLVALLEAPQLAHSIYNAVCESMLVSELKQAVESLNPNVRVRLGQEHVAGNPQRLDSGRFAREFDFQADRIAHLLKRVAGA
jgi:nucleoside-diphosphate-sugar epimerase